MPNTERIKQVIEFLKENEPHFSMRRWFLDDRFKLNTAAIGEVRVDAVPAQHECNSVGCIAGHITMMYNRGLFEMTAVERRNYRHIRYIQKLAQRLLDLDLETSEFLFLGKWEPTISRYEDYHLRLITFPEVIKALELLAEGRDITRLGEVIMAARAYNSEVVSHKQDRKGGEK